MYILAKIIPYSDSPGHFIEFYYKAIKDYKEAVDIAAKERYDLVTIYDETNTPGLQGSVHNLGMPDEIKNLLYET